MRRRLYLVEMPVARHVAGEQTAASIRHEELAERYHEWRYSHGRHVKPGTGHEIPAPPRRAAGGAR